MGSTCTKELSDSEPENDELDMCKKDVYSKEDIFNTLSNCKYHIIAKLASGGYSTVYIGSSVEGEKVAMKVIEKNSALNVEDITLEVKIIRKMHHRNIVHFKDFYENKNCYVIVEEYIKGIELFKELTDRAFLPENDTKIIIRQITSALEYLHKHSIIHRDLKPDNILLLTERQSEYGDYCNDSDSEEDDEDMDCEDNKIYSGGGSSYYRVKLIDFGTAIFDVGDNPSTPVRATIDYTSPELLDPKQNYTNKVDMWSLGVICYVLLSGLLPFDDESNDRKARKIIENVYKFPNSIWKDISENAKDFIRHLLINDPKKRMSASDALLHPFLSQKSSIEMNIRSDSTTNKNTLENSDVLSVISPSTSEDI